MAVAYVLIRRFGARHIQTTPWKLGSRYSACDLRFDLRMYPFACSIGGHPIRPFVDFHELADRLLWFTFLREPRARLVSQYLFDTSRGVLDGLPFKQWLNTTMDNWQVRWLAGEPDLDKAKRILTCHMRCVALQEKFVESMLLVGHRLGIDGLEAATPGRINATKPSATKEHVMAELDRYQEIVVARHALDLELYRYALENIWPRQVEEYGAERLVRDAAHARSTLERDSWLSRLRSIQGTVYRDCVYKPAIAVYRTVARARGD